MTSDDLSLENVTFCSLLAEYEALIIQRYVKTMTSGDLSVSFHLVVSSRCLFSIYSCPDGVLCMCLFSGVLEFLPEIEISCILTQLFSPCAYFLLKQVSSDRNMWNNAFIEP